MKNRIKLLVVLIGGLFYGQTLTTQVRDDAGLPTTQSGFYETFNPINYPNGAKEWWHLLDVRHTKSDNNYGMQFAGSFFDQNLWFRKVNNNSNMAWSKVVLENSSGNVGIGSDNPYARLDVNTNNLRTLLNFQGKSAITFIPNNGNSVFHISHGLNNDLAISEGSNVDEGRLVTILNNGNVGIGTKNPVSKLEVSGGGDLTLKASGQDSGDIIFSQISNVQNGRIWSNNDGGLNFSGNNNNPIFQINNNGNVSVREKLEAKEIKVTQTPTADFVFEESYPLAKLEDVEKHIKAKKHLPEIASAKEMEKEGVNIGEFQIKLLQKIEELTLYSIEQNKKLKQLEDKNSSLEKQIAAINEKLVK